MKFIKQYLVILALSSLLIGCLKGLPTRPSNDIEALYKCRLGVDTQSCEKEFLWWLFALIQSQSDTQPIDTSDGGSGGTTTTTYTIGGTITGLTTSGLVLQNNGGDDLSVTANATTFTFATKVSGAYAVTVKTQPTGLTCSITSGSGTVIANVTNISINCVTPTPTTYAVSLSILGGFTGTQLSGLNFQNNGGNTITVNGSTTFPVSFSPQSDSSSYNVTISSQPTDTAITCSIQGTGSGTISGANVTININCSSG